MTDMFDTITRTKDQKEVVTIYTTCGFGSIIKYVGTLIELGKQNYAQFNNVPYIKYIPMGKRKLIGFVKAYKPFMIVLKGINHPEPKGLFNKVDKEYSETFYQSYDERYITDFNNVFDSYLEANKDLILMDVRR